MLRTCAAALAVLLLGCGGKSPPSTTTTTTAPPPATPPPATPQEEIAALAQRACACPDQACATAVADDTGAWVKRHATEKLDDDKTVKSGEELFKCLADKNADLTKMMAAARDAQQARKPPKTGSSAENDAIAKFADSACACTDAACGTKVADDFAGWLLANKNARGDEDEAAKNGERMFKCLTDVKADMTKLMQAAQEVSK